VERVKEVQDAKEEYKPMSRGPSALKQSDITKVLKGAQCADATVTGIEINRDGSAVKIRLTLAADGTPVTPGSGENEWDVVLVPGDDHGAH
jgi:hypothetical protein